MKRNKSFIVIELTYSRWLQWSDKITFSRQPAREPVSPPSYTFNFPQKTTNKWPQFDWICVDLMLLSASVTAQFVVVRSLRSLAGL